uniref:Uncharacterized protein n=1 Tax=Arundo donax TaxID=35708 RepID=A0A0A9D8K3_ARUDO
MDIKHNIRNMSVLAHVDHCVQVECLEIMIIFCLIPALSLSLFIVVHFKFSMLLSKFCFLLILF